MAVIVVDGGTGLSGQRSEHVCRVLWARCGRADLPLARVSGLGLLPASAGLADLPMWSVTIEAHAAAALDLDVRSRSIRRSLVLVIAQFSFGDRAILILRPSVFDSTRAHF